jgi:hypothetical protein
MAPSQAKAQKHGSMAKTEIAKPNATPHNGPLLPVKTMADFLTPPPELAQRLWNNFRSSYESDTDSATAWNEAIAEAFQAGADQELEACCEYLVKRGQPFTAGDLRATHRPKPPSLKEQALADFDWLIGRTLGRPEFDERSERIRRALETLDD